MKKTLKYRHRGIKKIVFFIFSICVFALSFFIMAVERQLLPTVIEITKIKATDTINTVIATAVNELVTEKKLQSSDFYIKSLDQYGKIQTLEVNTILIDSLCSGLAEIISGELSGLTTQTVEIPLGAMFGISGMSNFGPSYSVAVRPLGSATVNYSSSFESTGINQINFQIWLDVTSKLQIVNPMQNSDIIVERKILLVNTVFSGEVPSFYIDK